VFYILIQHTILFITDSSLHKIYESIEIESKHYVLVFYIYYQLCDSSIFLMHLYPF